MKRLEQVAERRKRGWTRGRSRGWGASGQAIVEFALFLPMLIILVMGILDMARAYSVLQVVTNAAREGAREGIIPSNSSAAVTATVDAFLTVAGQTDCSTVGTKLGAAGSAGDSTVVTVSCTFTALTGTLIPGWEGTFPLSQTATMRHE